MKTDISIPNPISEAAEQLARKLGMTLSELYTAAISAYMAVHQSDITEKLNRIYENEPSTVDPDLINAQLASLEKEIW
jgi:hypothetical protein